MKLHTESHGILNLLMKKPVTIIIPVKNEEGSVVKVLQSIRNKVKVPYYIIVVDGCSTDKTVSLVKDYIKKNRNIRIILTTPKTSGFKDSIDVGVAASKTSYVVVMMSDLSDDSATINKMYAKIKDGSDIVVGSRYMPGGRKLGEPKIQGSISRMVSKTLQLLTGIPTHDVSNPFRLYRKSLLTGIKTESRANEIPIEVIFKAYFKGAKITEVPTIWRGRKFGKSKFKLLKVVPAYAKLYIWVLLSSWRMQLARLY